MSNRVIKYLLIVFFILCCAPILVRAESRIPILVVGKTSYTNVVVVGKTADDVFIRHNGGLASFRVQTLSDAVKAQLGLPAHPITTNLVASTQPKENRSLPSGSHEEQVAQSPQQPPPSPEQPQATARDNGRGIFKYAPEGAAAIVLLIVLRFLVFRTPKAKENAAATDSDELTQVLDGRLPLSVLIRQGDTERALTIYAEQMQRKYSRIPAGTPCVSCEQNAGSVIEFYRWAASCNERVKFGALSVLLLFVGWIRFTRQWTVVRFETAHCFCPKCARKTKLRRGLSVIVKGITFFCLLVGLVLGIPCGTAVLYFKSIGADHDAKGFIWGALVGFAGLAIGIVGHRWEKILQIPPKIRFIGRSPFYLSAVNRVH